MLGIVPERNRGLTPILQPTKLADKVMANAGVAGPMATDIPLKRTAHGKFRYPLRKMIVGDHFFVPCEGRSVEQTQNAVTSSVNNIQNKTNMRFTQRRYPPKGIRVWRTR